MKQILKLLLLLSLTFIITQCSLFEDDLDDPGNPSTHLVGDTLWIHEIAGKDSLFIGKSMALGTDGAVYYSVAGGTVFWTAARIRALNPESGELLWESQKLDHVDISSQIMVGDNGTIYVLGFYKLYALDTGSGSTLWTWEVPDELPSPDDPQINVYTKGQLGYLALADDGTILTATVGSGSYRRAVFGISPQGAKVYHNLKATGWGVETGIYIGKNNTAYYYANEISPNLRGRRLVALDTKTGSIKWTTPIENSCGSSNNIAIQDNGNLLCAIGNGRDNYDYKYHIVDGNNGSIIWTSSANSTCFSKFIAPDGSFYRDKGAFQIDFNTGTEKIVVDVPLFNQTIIGAINSNNRIVVAFSDVDGQRKLGVFYPDGLIDFETTVAMAGLEGINLLISDEKVVFGIINDFSTSRIPSRICAIQSNARLASSGWPRRNHDNRNTSNINKF